MSAAGDPIAHRPDELRRSLERLARSLGRLGAGLPFAYGLVDRRPVPLSPIGWLAWVRQHPDDDDAWRRVGLDVVGTPLGPVEVSTVFLMATGALDDDALFETMISGPGDRQQFERYPTWEDAERGHRAIVEALQLHGWPTPD